MHVLVYSCCITVYSESQTSTPCALVFGCEVSEGEQALSSKLQCSGAKKNK